MTDEGLAGTDMQWLGCALLPFTQHLLIQEQLIGAHERRQRVIKKINSFCNHLTSMLVPKRVLIMCFISFF